MHPADIQASLKKRGITQTQIAKELNVKGWSVYAVIQKKQISDRVMRAIAEKIGIHHHDVFPEYYRGPRAQRFNPNK